MKIGELARLVGLSTKTVRYYESIGLLAEPPRTSSGYRDYSLDAADRLRFIREAQASGLALAEIQSVLELKDAGSTSCAHTAALVQRHVADIDAQIEQLQASRAVLAEIADRAQQLDPATCTDPHRCQVISGSA